MADYNSFGEYDEIDLNGSIEQESQFVDIPVGDYDGVIDHYEIGVCSWDNDYNGKKMLTVYINLDVNGQEVQVSDNIPLVKKMEWKLSQLFLGTGQKKKGEALPNANRAIKEMPGMRVRVSYVEDRKGKKRQDGTPYKNIGKYYEKKPAAAAMGWNGGF